MAWSTQVEGTDAVAREVLARELVWNAYPLGNFGEPYRPFMSVMHASSLDRRHATCVLFRRASVEN